MVGIYGKVVPFLSVVFFGLAQKNGQGLHECMHVCVVGHTEAESASAFFCVGQWDNRQIKGGVRQGKFVGATEKRPAVSRMYVCGRGREK